MENWLLKLFGWKAALFHGDPTVYDRYCWLRDNLAPGKLRTLEAGCGSGGMVFYAAKLGNEALGISFNERNMQVANHRAELLNLDNARFIEGDLRQLDQHTELGQFDQIVCFECIEHIINDQKLLLDLSRLLKPGGKLLLTTPNKKYRPLLGDDPNALSKIEDGGHVRWGYEFDELTHLFTKAKLKVTQQSYVSGWISQQTTNFFRWVNLKANAKTAWALTLPLRFLKCLDRPVTKLLRYPYLSIAVVGVKQES